MDRHEFEWPPAIAGVALVAIGVGFSIGNLRWEAVEAAAVWAVIAVLVGLLITASAVQRTLRGGGLVANEEDAD